MRPSLLIYGQDVGGARVLLPVVKRLRRGRASRVTTVGTEAACEVFLRGGVPCRTLEAAGLSLPVAERAAVRWLAALSPDVYVGDAGHLRDGTAAQLMSACRRLGVPTLALLDHWKNLDRFQGRNGNRFRHAPDVLGAMDQGIAKSLERLGLAKERIRVVGHPYLEEMHQARTRLLAPLRIAALRKRIGVPHDAVLLVCCSEMLHAHGADAPCTSRCRPLFRGATPEGTLLDAVELAAKKAAKQSGRQIFVVLRPHPFERRLAATPTWTRVPLLDDRICSDVEAMAAADVVAGLSAMPLIQAYVLGKPVVSLSLPSVIGGSRGPLARFHWDISRTFLVVKNRRTLVRTLVEAIRLRPRVALDAHVRTVLLDATGRVVRLICQMAVRRSGVAAAGVR